MFRTHIQEWINKAYIRAIAAKAGINIQGFEQDYATDGTFRTVKTVEEGFIVFGPGLDFQAKSTTAWRRNETHIGYDMKVAAYNKLVSRNREDSVPCILILCCLSPVENDWVLQTEEQLLMQKCCYWHYVRGENSDNQNEQVVHIPRTQLLTPNSLVDLMAQVAEGTFSND